MEFRTDQAMLDLTGTWSFAFSMNPTAEVFASAAELAEAGLAIYPCTVPGNFELDLHANGLVPEPYYAKNILELQHYEQAHVWYWRRFTGEMPATHDMELVFRGLDCYADIYLNGTLLGTTDNMLITHAFPVSALLSGENELFIHIKPAVEMAKQYDYPPTVNAGPINYESLYVRKAPHMYGWDIMPRVVSAGIWRPVTLYFRPRERWHELFLETVSIAPDHSAAHLVLHYHTQTRKRFDERYRIEIEGRCGDAVFTAGPQLRFDAGQVEIGVAHPKLWWPRGRGEANLYQVTARLLKDDEVIDSVTFTHGIRSVALERTSVAGPTGDGEFCFIINGEKTFILGSNWVPADAFHSRDPERIPAIIALAEDIGINLFRCWGGNVYEDDDFYAQCDAKGIMIWQDFAMACAIYPQDEAFQQRLTAEVRQVVQRLRQHPCIVLWAGDNECDQACSWFGRSRDPNENVLTRKLLPEILRTEDITRPFLPSSPYIDATAQSMGMHYLPENHLWGPRDYYKSAFYLHSLCHFVSEIGYHGCPDPESIHRFISPEKCWPYQDNDEWILHCTSPVPSVSGYDYRVELMAKQVRELFGHIPETLEEFAFASQASQAEANKFFIEFFRGTKWRRTGIIWWNLIDGWPQFSDAVVDYYFVKKLAYHIIKNSQQPLLLTLTEPEYWEQCLVACNDTRQDIALEYRVTDLDTDAVLVEGRRIAAADRVTALASIAYSQGEKHCYLITWQSDAGVGRNHYLAGAPPFDLARYRAWLEKVGVLPVGNAKRG